MVAQKSSKSKNSKTVRRHRTSTSGKIKVPVDVRSDTDLSKFRQALKDSNLTIILVYATWCPHCHTLMPHFDAAAKSPNRSVSAVKINETMLDKVNNYIKKNVNNKAAPISVNGYPSIILVNKNAEKITDIEPVRDTESLKKVMENAGPLATNAGLNTGKNIGAKNGKINVSANNLKNIDMGEDELKGSISSENKNMVNTVNSVKNNRSTLNIEEATAPSPLDTFSNSSETTNIKAPSASVKKEAEEITSLQATIPAGTPSIAIKPVSPPVPSDVESSESVRELGPAEKVGGGCGCGIRRGGSLMGAISRTAYTLAPAAVLLATAATVMKGNKRATKKSHKGSKKYRKSSKKYR